jgi:hypothetical protein
MTTTKNSQIQIGPAAGRANEVNIPLAYLNGMNKPITPPPGDLIRAGCRKFGQIHDRVTGIGQRRRPVSCRIGLGSRQATWHRRCVRIGRGRRAWRANPSARRGCI